MPDRVSQAYDVGGRDAAARVSLGIADYGFDILHPALVAQRHPHNGSARSHFRSLIDQNSGRCFGPWMLDRMAALGPSPSDRAVADSLYDPHQHYYDETEGRHGAHGTMMASIAIAVALRHSTASGLMVAPGHSATGNSATGNSGTGRDVQGRGARPVDLHAVQLALPMSMWIEVAADGRPSWLDWSPASAPVWQGWRDYLHARPIIDALTALVEDARRRRDCALVINLSLGTWAGAHDGTSPVERHIADLTGPDGAGERGPVVAVVVPTGNAGADRGHASATAYPGAPCVLTWSVSAMVPGPHKLEIWYASEHPLAVEIELPDAQRRRIEPGPTADLHLGGCRVGVADHRLRPSGGLHGLRVSCSFAHVPGLGGSMPLRITLAADRSPARIHAWVERTATGMPASHLTPHDPHSTIGGLATADGAIVVGALDATGPGRARHLPASGRGPHPWAARAGHPLPHRLAAGHRVVAARSKHADTTLTTGTSAACAAVAGELFARLSHAVTTTRTARVEAEPLLRRVIDDFRAGLDHLPPSLDDRPVRDAKLELLES